MSLRFPSLIALCIVLMAAGQPARAASDSPEPLSVTDPRLGEILYYFYQDDYFPAIVRLQAARERGQLSDQQAQSELLLGDMLLSYGQHLEAANIFEDLHADNVDRENRDLAWLTLAKHWYRQGALDRAQEALHHMSDNLPDVLAREARTLQGQIHLDSGQYDRAIDLLQAWNDNSELASYARFNLSVALLQSGRVEAGLANLDALGGIEPLNEELSSLRDKANLTLGYALLQGDQPRAASVALQRVRSEGPFTNRAMLGLGWADARLGNYDSALQWWTRLREGDLSDPAVLESMIAVPYALTQLNSISQASDGYRTAIGAFEAQLSRIDRAIGFMESDDNFDRFLGDGHLDSTGSFWQFGSSPQMPEARYLLDILATNEFHEGLENYRDLASLDDSLDRWWQDVDVYLSVLESQKQSFERVRPGIKDALAEADFNDAIYKQRRFAGLLDSVERFNDWMALANEQEFDTWRKVSDAQRSPALAADTPEAQQMKERIRWIKGVLQWELERKAEERMHQAVRDLRQTGDLIAEAQEVYDRIDNNLRTMPARFAELGEQSDELMQRIVAMQMRVADTRNEQRAYLQSMAVGELMAQKERLTVYTLQARLGLAEIYELPASGGGD